MARGNRCRPGREVVAAFPQAPSRMKSDPGTGDEDHVWTPRFRRKRRHDKGGPHM